MLIKLGYQVEIPRHVESGRAAFSEEYLKIVKKYVIKNVQFLSGIVSDKTPLVGIESSCILSFHDEYPDIIPIEMRDTAKYLAKNCLLFDGFVMREVKEGWELFSNAWIDNWSKSKCDFRRLLWHGRFVWI